MNHDNASVGLEADQDFDRRKDVGSRNEDENASKIPKSEDEATHDVADDDVLFSGFYRSFPENFQLKHPDERLFADATGSTRALIEDEMAKLLRRRKTPDQLFPDSTLKYGVGRHFFQVYWDSVEANFPSSDKDWRSMLVDFRKIFRQNLMRRIVVRRAIQFFCTLLFYATLLGLISFNFGADYFGHAQSAFQRSVPAIVVSGLVAYFVYWVAGQLSGALYQRALQRSCTVVGQNTLERLARLYATLNNVKIVVRDLYDQTEERWIRESDWYTSALVWIPMRILEIENYFQSSMWLMRRHLMFGQWIGAFLAMFTMLVAIYVAGLIPLALGDELKATLDADSDLEAVLLYSLLGWSVLLAILSFFGSSTAMEYIKGNVPISQWKTFGSIEVDKGISGVVSFLIKKFIMLRDVGRSR